jgi:hypothetical protein
MAHHHARDGYDTVKVPEKYRPLLRRLQRGTWTRTELEWLLRQHPDLPLVVAAVVKQKLAELAGRSSPSPATQRLEAPL